MAAAEAKPQIRAGCYLRISSDPDDKRQGTARQREDTAVLCEVQGWSIAEYYEDNNRSASNGKDRPEWKRLLADIKAGKIDAIAAWDQDRNWRMMSELEDLRRFFAGVGRKVELATTGQGVIDLFSPTGVLQAQLKTMMSEHEIATMRVRQLRAARQRAEQGKPKWKRAFGYVPDTRDKKHDDGTRQIDESVQPLVVEAYERIVRREKLEDICAFWNGAGKPGLNGQPWTASTVSLFLRSPRNAGLRTHNGEIVLGADGQPVKGTWPPLVGMELWEAAQTVMTEPGRGPGPKSVRKHLLTGVLWCGREGCDGYLSGNWAMLPNGTGRVLAYRCKSCRGLSVRATDVQPLVMGALIKRLSRPDAVKLLRKKTYDPGEARRARTDEAVLRAKLAQLGRDFASAPPEFTAAALADVQGKLDDLALRQQDQEQRRLLDGVPLGTDKVSPVVEAWPDDRLRGVIAKLMVVTVLPVGSGHKVFNRERVDIAWK
jgi:DNA invertase Pin-like site-specific DNA recombinase